MSNRRADAAVSTAKVAQLAPELRTNCASVRAQLRDPGRRNAVSQMRVALEMTGEDLQHPLPAYLYDSD